MRPIRTPRTTGTYGAPPGHEDSIGGLPYWREDNEYRSKSVLSVWTFSDEERAAVAAGANLELEIIGEPIPPVSLAVTEEREL